MSELCSHRFQTPLFTLLCHFFLLQWLDDLVLFVGLYFVLSSIHGSKAITNLIRKWKYLTLNHQMFFQESCHRQTLIHCSLPHDCSLGWVKQASVHIRGPPGSFMPGQAVRARNRNIFNFENLIICAMFLGHIHTQLLMATFSQLSLISLPISCLCKGNILCSVSNTYIAHMCGATLEVMGNLPKAVAAYRQKKWLPAPPLHNIHPAQHLSTSITSLGRGREVFLSSSTLEFTL